MINFSDEEALRIPSSAPEIKIHAAISIKLPEATREKSDDVLYKEYIDDQSFKDILTPVLKEDFRYLVENKYDVTMVVSRRLILFRGSIYADVIYSIPVAYSNSEIARKIRANIRSLEESLSQMVKFALAPFEDFIVESKLTVAPPPFETALSLSRIVGAFALILTTVALACLLGIGGDWCQCCKLSPEATEPTVVSPGSDHAKTPPCDECEPRYCDTDIRHKRIEEIEQPIPCY